MLPAPTQTKVGSLARGVDQMRLDTAKVEFITDMRVDGLGGKSLQTYDWHVRKFIEWVLMTTRKANVTQFTSQLVRDYLQYQQERDLSQNTLYGDSSILRQFAKWGVRKRYWRDEDVEDIPVYEKPKKLPRPYNDGERDRLVDLPLTGQDEVLRALLYWAGLRQAEARAVRLRDLRAPGTLPDGTVIPGRIRVHGKGRKERDVPMPPNLWEILKHHLNSHSRRGAPMDQTLLVQTRGKTKGQPWSARMVERRMNQWGASAGVEGAVAHRWRHTYATNLHESNTDIRVIQTLMGHESLTTTEIYTHVSDQRRDEAVLRLSAARAKDV